MSRQEVREVTDTPNQDAQQDRDQYFNPDGTLHYCGGPVADCPHAIWFIEERNYYGHSFTPVCYKSIRRGVKIAATRMKEPNPTLLTKARFLEWEKHHDAFVKAYWQDKEQRRKAAQEQEDRVWRETYEAHLRSPYWLGIRAKVFLRDQHLCQGCLTRSAAHAHHLTYERMGRELACDLISLCERCHALIHEKRTP